MLRLPRASRRARLLLLGAATLAVAGALWGYLVLRRDVERALASAPGTRRPLGYAPLPPAAARLPAWGTGEVVGVARSDAGLVLAGGRGVWPDGAGDESWALPTLRVSAFTLWRGRPVAASSGGLFRRGDAGWEELRSGFGPLEVRALAESPAGELLIGARQGLFRAAWAATSLDRLDQHPVRSLAVGPGIVLAGGEQGLWRVESSGAVRVETPDPWIEGVFLDGPGAWVVTAAGLAHGPPQGPAAAVAGGDGITAGLPWEGAFLGLAETPAGTLRRLDVGGRGAHEALPAPARRLIGAHGELFADTLAGLFHRRAGGWSLVRAAGDALPSASAHVGALAVHDGRVAVGLFDGGLIFGDAASMTGAGDAGPRGGDTTARIDWREVPGSAAWGVNGLLSTGGALYVASLRGAARLVSQRLEPLPGPGAAFSLASTADGVAIGYGQGVLLPGTGLLSAFHGLPGNQALALAARPGPAPALFVGTPSGLGGIESRRVSFGVTTGDGLLPHPWVTALALVRDVLYVGTYGGGIARRLPPSGAQDGTAGRFEAFAETEGLKINTGCLIEVDGRIWAGSDGRGLWRLTRDGARFEPVRVTLPSPRVTALAADGAALWIGTTEGVARLPLRLGRDGDADPE